jgi:putative DNA primase/helicase
MNKPTALPVNLESIPYELKLLKQWVAWRYEWDPKDERWKKVPKNPRTGNNASTKRNSTWGTADQAYKRMIELGLDGIGFVFTEDDPFLGIDLDDVMDGTAIAAQAQSLLDRFPTFAERSPSGTGIHIVLRCSTELSGRYKKDGIEIFRRNQFLTFTGHLLPDRPPGTDVIADLTAEVVAWHADFLGAPLDRTPVTIGGHTQREVPVCESTSITNAITTCRRMSPKFDRLYADGDLTNYDGDDSRADLALAAYLVKAGLEDSYLIEQAMRGSALNRDKWDRDNYLKPTIEKALATIVPSRSTPDEPEPLHHLIDRLMAERDAAEARAAQNGELVRWFSGIMGNATLKNARLVTLVLSFKIASLESGQDDPPYKISIAEIAKAAGTTPQTASRHIGTLEKAGLLHRARLTEPGYVDTQTGEIVPTKTWTLLTPVGGASTFAREAANRDFGLKWGGLRSNGFGRMADRAGSLSPAPLAPAPVQPSVSMPSRSTSGSDPRLALLCVGPIVTVNSLRPPLPHTA